MSDETSVLVLAPYRGHWEIKAYPTSRVVKANCGHLAWLSPQGEPLVDSAYTICVECLPPDATDLQKRAVPGAVESLRQQHGDSAAAFARAFMRAKNIKET